MMAQHSPSITALKGVGPKMADALSRLHIVTVHDLLFHLPFRYEDRTQIKTIRALTVGDRVLIEGELVDLQIVGAKRYLRCVLRDDHGHTCDLVFFHFVKGHQQKLSRLKERVRCFGEVRRAYTGQLEMVHPEYAFVQTIRENSVLSPSDRLSPVYLATKGIQQITLRKLVQQSFALIDRGLELPELLPPALLASFEGLSLIDALRFIHFPPVGVNQAQLLSFAHPAQQRLAFEELIAHHLSLQTVRQQLRATRAIALPENHAFKKNFLAQLPFSLTNAQLRVSEEISRDLSQPVPMLRLVQGDVGSGKTVVACLAALQAIKAGYQVAVMAPTEILSQQHYQTFSRWLSPLQMTVCHLTGRQSVAEQEAIKWQLQSGEAQLVVGTHALFQQSVSFSCLALLIIDEQHRFGVHQRLALMEKGVQSQGYPHQLIMTATPIPRTLAMTAYADLDCSMIDELPPGRQAITTVLVSNARRQQVIERVNANCMQGRQAYWICTLITESDVLQCQAAEETAMALQEALPKLRIGLIHGRLKSDDKQAVMEAFQSKKIDLLVATTVVEVGVDVPTASLMIIENPERFGLAQLHQLRGRIGRGSESSFCVLLYQNPLSQQALARLSVMRETQDGFKIAEQDLEMRGPGEVLGVKQSGLMSLRIADWVRDEALLQQAQLASQHLLSEFPHVVPLLVKRWVGAQIKYMNA